MRLEVLNRSGLSIPRTYLSGWLKALSSALVDKKVLHDGHLSLKLYVVFVSAKEIRGLNRTFRGKNKPTDVLSFESDDPELIGELVICPEVIKQQAKEHGLRQQEEYGYMLTHGVLHLLGYEHEQGGENERVMFSLQDELFERLRDKSFS